MHIIYKSTRDFVASDNKITIEVDLNFEAKERCTYVAVRSKDDIVGMLSEPEGLEEGLYSISLDFEGRDSVNQTFYFLGFDSFADGEIKSEPFYESNNINVSIEGLVLPEWAKYKPYVTIRDFDPEITNNQLPLIKMQLDKYLKKGKTKKTFEEVGVDDTMSINAFINGEDVTEDSRFDGEYLSILSVIPLNQGPNQVDLTIKFDRYSNYISESKEIIFETTGPVLSVEEEIVYTSRLYPNFLIQLSDNISIGNLKALQLTLNSEPIDFSATALALVEDGEGQHVPVSIAIKDELWSGLHEIVIQMTDEAGNVSEPIIQKIFIDIKSPEILQESPLPGAVINAHNPKFLFTVKDNPEPRLLDLPIKRLRGPGTKKADRYASVGIYTIRDLLKLNALEQDVPNITPHDLQRTIQRAQIIHKTGIDPNLYQPLLHLFLREVLDAPVKVLAQKSGLSEKYIRALKNELNPLHLSLDTSVINRTRIAQFALLKGSGAGSFKLWLDKKEVTDKGVLVENEIIYEHDGILDHGLHVLELEVLDKCGNKCFYRTQFTADKDMPEFYDAYPQSESFINDTPLTMSVKYRDLESGIDPSSVKVYLDDNLVGLDSVKISHTGVSYNRKRLSEEKHKFRVEVDDMVGNHAVFVTQFVYDLTPPEASLHEDPNLRATHEDHIEIEGVVSEMAKRIFVNGIRAQQSEDRSFMAKVPLKERGWHIIQAEVEDKSGNTITTNEVNIFKVGPDDIAIYGRIFTSDEKPVPGARVYIQKTESWTVADNKGRFCLYTNPIMEGINLLQIKPPINHSDNLQPFNMEVNLSKGSAVTYGNLYLLTSKLEDGQIIEANRPGYTGLATAERVDVALPNMNLEFPNQIQDTKVAISDVKANQIPVKLPGNIEPDQVVSMEPEGLKINSANGAPLNFNSHKKLTPGSLIPLFSYSQEKGKWSFGAMAKVAPDGQTISTLPNSGIRHFSLWTPLLPALKIDVKIGDVRTPTSPEVTPLVTSEVSLPTIIDGSSQILPKLIYNHRAAHPQVEFVSIFKGMEEIVSTEQIGPFNQTEVRKVLKAVEQLMEYYVKKEEKFDWSGSVLGLVGSIGLGILYPPAGIAMLGALIAEGGVTYDEIEQGKLVKSETTHFLPFSGLDSLNEGSTYEKRIDGDYIRETVRNIMANPIQAYLIRKKITTDITKTIWPGIINHQYLLGFTESGLLTHEGSLTKKGTDNRDIPVLAPDETLRHDLIAEYNEPPTNNTVFYSSGVQNFISQFHVKGEEYETAQSNTVILEFDQNEEYLQNLNSQVKNLETMATLSEDQIEKLARMKEELAMLQATKNAYQSDTALSSENRNWNSTFDILSKSTAGQAIIQDLSKSNFGRGWDLANWQRIYKLSLTKVLVIDGEEKLIFHVKNNLINKWWEDLSTEMITPSSYNEQTVFCQWKYQEGNSDKEALVFGRAAKLYKVEYEFTAGQYQFQEPTVLLELPEFKERVVVTHRFKEMETRDLLERAGYHRRYKLHWSKWSIKWKGWHPVRVETWGSEWIEPVYRKETYWTGNWVNPHPKSDDKYPIIKGHITSVVSDAVGNLFVSDAGSHRIFKVSSDGQYVIVCGKVDETEKTDRLNIDNEYQEETQTFSWKADGFSPDGAIAANAFINYPTGLEIDLNGDLIFAEKRNHRIRRVKNGMLETLGGNGELEYQSPSGIEATTTQLPSPEAIRIDPSGNIFCLLTTRAFEGGGTEHAVVKLSPHIDGQGQTSWLAQHLLGTPGTISADKVANYRIVNCSDIEISDAGSKLYIYSSSRIDVLDINLDPNRSFMDNYAGGNHDIEHPNDGAPAFEAKLTAGGSIRRTLDGDLLVLDPGHHSLRLITKTVMGPGNLKMVGPAGYTHSILEKTASNEWTRSYANGRKIIFNADTGLPITETDSNGKTINYTYSNGKLTRIGFSGKILDFYYDADGKIIYSEDHLNRRTDYYFTDDDLKKVELPDGTKIEFTYDTNGKLLDQKVTP